MAVLEILAWLNMLQLIATLFLVPAIWVFRKAWKAFVDIEKTIAELRHEMHRDFVKKRKPHLTIVK